MLIKETHHLDRRLNPIRDLAEPVSLVWKEDVLHGYATRLEAIHDLLSLDNWHVGVIGTVLNHRGSLDVVELIDRREFVEHVFLRCWIAVLHGGDRSHPRFGLLEESDEVHDAEQINASSKQVRILGDASHGHVSAVRATGNAEA